jgi:MFS transporter, SP family, sugar:H+ symporter
METHTAKAEHAHLEQVDSSVSASGATPNLKITRNSLWENRRGIIISLIINMSLFEYGLDQGTVNGFQAMPGFLLDFGYADPNIPGGLGISTKVQQLVGSLVSLGMLVSTFASGWVADKIGRKGGLWCGCLLMIISVTLQIAVINFGALYSGRLILGFSNGFLMLCSQLYLQESMPANLRSLSFTLYQFWTSFGGLVGAIIINSTSKLLNRASYRIPLGILYVIPVVLSIALVFLPETPRYYAVKNKPTEAEKALRFLRGSSFTDIQIREEVAEIFHAIEAERELNAHAGYRKLFSTKTDVKRTLTSLGLGLYAAASGVPFVIQYGIYFFLLAGDTNPFRDGVILLCVGLAGVISTPFFTGKVGKRAILMVGGATQALTMLGVGISYSVRGIDKTSGNVIIAMCSIFLFFASATTGPFAWYDTDG